VTPLYEVRDVTFRYQEAAALQGLSLRIGEGERVALLGANGSGKSTLLRLLDGLYFAESGSVSFRGQQLDEERFAGDEFAYGFRRQVALVFQNPDVQLFNPSVFDEVAFGPLHMGWPRSEVAERVAAALELLGIGALCDRPPHHLSGGEKKKVALASVLVLDPEVILLDEPTASLDPRSQTQLIDFLTRWGDGRKTIVTATHDLHMLEDIAEVCHIFEHGRVVASGTPGEILHDRGLLERSNLIHAHRHMHEHLHREG
jgi:cobalt/nickel transport system ATP-binding protein